MKLIGPFHQILTLNHLPLAGKISDDELEIITNGGILVENGKIVEVGEFSLLIGKNLHQELEFIDKKMVVLPAMIDCHTHICFGGNRANDFVMRNAGKSYLEIAENGGGIWSTVLHTRALSEEELVETTLKRVNQLLEQGIATIEIKSGYGLNAVEELKMLRAIQKVKQNTNATIVSTCLSAHIKPRDFDGNNEDYLHYILSEILPIVKEENLAKRVDIFIEKSAFLPEESAIFLEKVKEMGFSITVHADQFTSGSSRIAVDFGAVSADHLEATHEDDIQYLANSNTVAVALPGASLGLGEPFTPARKILDAGGILAIASDWNPGSAPMGNLLTQVSILATYEKLTTAEVLAALTFRAAKALELNDRGQLKKDLKADFITFETENFQNILYLQGSLPCKDMYINGEKLINNKIAVI